MDSMIEADRYCKVCGDKAVYVNYGALTCDSCKTFFRRQNLHPKNLTCNYNGRCLINAKTRKDCTKCRLIKCFTIGMRSDVIGSATSERQRKNSFDRYRNSQHSVPYFFGPHPRHDENYPFVTRNENAERLPESEGYIGSSDSNSNSSDEPSKKVLNTIYHDQQKGSKLRSEHDRRSPEPVVPKKKCPEEIISSKVQEYQKSFLSLNHIATGYCYTRHLNPDEVMHIEAVKDAAAAIRSRVFITDDAKCTKPILAAMKLQSFGVDKLISGMARIDSFSQLNDKLKTTLLKGAVAEMMLVRSSMHFDAGTRGWTINAVDIPGSDLLSVARGKDPQLSIVPCSSKQSSVQQAMTPNVSFHLSVDLFKHIPGSIEWVEDYFKFCELLDQSWKEDEVLITLLMVLILFNPENVNVLDIKEIKYQQTYFQFMLKRYLETSCDTLVDAAAAFDRLKQARKLVSRLKTTFENTVLSINPEDICSLNPSLFNPFKSMVDGKNRTELDHNSTMFDCNPKKREETRMNPFAPRAVGNGTCTHPSGFWNRFPSSVSTQLDQCLKDSTTQQNQ